MKDSIIHEENLGKISILKVSSQFLIIVIIMVPLFDRQFLLDSSLLRFAQNGTRNMSFNSQDPDLYDHELKSYVHTASN